MKLLDIEITSAPFGQEITLHPTVIQDNEELLLIDCGYEGSLNLIEEQLKKQHLSIRDLTGIILSHDDIDHIGGLFEIKRAHPSVTVYSSRLEAPYISGEQKSLRLQQSEDLFETLPAEYRNWALAFQQALRSIKHVPVDRILEDHVSPFKNIEVIQTPGHTPGHISLYIPAVKTLIANDALVIENDELEIANPQYTLDISQAVASIRKLARLEIDTLHCYHGGTVVDHIPQKIEKLLSKYR